MDLGIGCRAVAAWPSWGAATAGATGLSPVVARRGAGRPPATGFDAGAGLGLRRRRRRGDLLAVGGGHGGRPPTQLRGLATVRRGVPAGVATRAARARAVRRSPPALAAPVAGGGPGPGRPAVLAGLRLPERVAVATQRRRPRHRARPTDAVVVVAPGDTLWAIAARLGSAAARRRRGPRSTPSTATSSAPTPAYHARPAPGPALRGRPDGRDDRGDRDPAAAPRCGRSASPASRARSPST